MRFTVSFSTFDYTDLGQPGPSATGLSNCTGVIRLEGRGTLTLPSSTLRPTQGARDHRRLRPVPIRPR
jgi:hypothetical protein